MSQPSHITWIKRKNILKTSDIKKILSWQQETMSLKVIITNGMIKNTIIIKKKRIL